MLIEGEHLVAQPIYKVFMGRPTDAWYQLSSTEQAELLAKLDEGRAKVGGKNVIMCNSSWSSDHYLYFGVEEFPDLESVQHYHAFLGEINWFRYLESETALGTKLDR